MIPGFARWVGLGNLRVAVGGFVAGLGATLFVVVGV